MAKSDTAKRLEEAHLAGRAPLYRWIFERYEELAPAINAAFVPSWAGLVRLIKDDPAWGGAKAPSRESVRQTWLRVETNKRRPPGAHKMTMKKKPAARKASASERAEIRAALVQPPVDDDDMELVSVKKRDPT